MPEVLSIRVAGWTRANVQPIRNARPTLWHCRVGTVEFDSLRIGVDKTMELVDFQVPVKPGATLDQAVQAVEEVLGKNPGYTVRQTYHGPGMLIDRTPNTEEES